jgi:hypothetical protein
VRVHNWKNHLFLSLVKKQRLRMPESDHTCLPGEFYTMNHVHAKHSDQFYLQCRCGRHQVFAKKEAYTAPLPPVAQKAACVEPPVGFKRKRFGPRAPIVDDLVPLPLVSESSLEERQRKRQAIQDVLCAGNKRVVPPVSRSK